MAQVRVNDPTRYELVAVKGERTILIGYTPRKNRHGALDMLTNRLRNGEMRLHRLARATGTDVGGWESRRGVIAECNGWTVKFTGRTQRDALATGELEDSIYLERWDG